MQLTIQQAAQQLGITRRQVRYRIANGTLPATKIGGRWRLDSEQLPGTSGQNASRQRKQASLRTAVEDALDVPASTHPKRYSLLDLRAFQIGAPLYREAAELLGPEHSACQAIYAALDLLARGCHRYRRDQKAAAYDAARDQASRAACALVLLGPPEARELLTRIEQELMAAIAGLMRHMERERHKRSAQKQSRSQP